MEIVGKASKRDKAAIRAAFGDAAACLPSEYVNTVARYGPGELNGFLRFPDPTERSGLHETLQTTLRERGRVAQSRGHWLSVPAKKLTAAAVLGIDRRGAVVIAVRGDSADDDDVDDETDDAADDAGGSDALRAFDKIEELFGALLGSAGTADADDAEEDDAQADDDDDSDALYVLHPDGRAEGLRFYSDLVRLYGRDELPRTLGGVWRDWIDVPNIYATDRPPSDDAYDALVAGNRAAVDAAVARFVGREVLPFAYVALVARLLGPDGAAVDAELRADTAIELYTLASRRIPRLGENVPLRDIRRALNGQDGDEVLARLVKAASLREASFFDEPAAADSTGDIPDAAERGLIVPAGVTVDLDARLAECVAAWRAQDPDTSIEPLLAQLDALPKVVRDGYLLLVARLDHSLRYDPAFKGLVDEEDALAREIRDAWPALVLALRSERDWQAHNALELLHEHRVAEAVPYLRSVVEHLPAYVIEPWFGEKAYVEIAQLRPNEIKDLLLPMVAPDAKSDGRRRRAVDELLERYADDDRVFEMYLSRFIPALPFSETAITRAKRWNDPRVIPALRTQLEMEGRFRSAGEAQRDVEYGEGYGIVAKRLARLGDDVGKAALAEYRRAERRARARYL